MQTFLPHLLMYTIYSAAAAIVHYSCQKSKQTNTFNLFFPGPWSYLVPRPLQVNQLEPLNSVVQLQQCTTKIFSCDG